jgi:hypothetical protein
MRSFPVDNAIWIRSLSNLANSPRNGIFAERRQKELNWPLPDEIVAKYLYGSAARVLKV